MGDGRGRQPCRALGFGNRDLLSVTLYSRMRCHWSSFWHTFLPLQAHVYLVLFSKCHCAERATDAHLRLRKLRGGRALGHRAEHGLESVLHQNFTACLSPLLVGLLLTLCDIDSVQLALEIAAQVAHRSRASSCRRRSCRSFACLPPHFQDASTRVARVQASQSPVLHLDFLD